jgi:hypothetical protein
MELKNKRVLVVVGEEWVGGCSVFEGAWCAGDGE